jgi:uncharacterized membrane protein YphA (DoxX/SURF4 family)
MTFLVRFDDDTTTMVQGADAYEQEGPLTTFFDRNGAGRLASGMTTNELAGVLEAFGGLLFLIGLFTRPVAFVLCGFMAAAYFMGHAPQGHVLLPMLNQGELAVLYCFVFLYFVFAGAGAWSVDSMRQRPAFAAPAR